MYERLSEYAYPNRNNISVIAKEVKILTKSQKKSTMEKGENDSGKFWSSASDCSPWGGSPVCEGFTAFLEGMDNVVVTTSAPDAVFASWTQIVARTGKTEAVELS